MEQHLQAPQRTAGRPVVGGSVRIGIGADPESLLPYASSLATSTDMQGFLFLQLAEVSSNLSGFEPRLAAEWEWSADHLGLEVRLRSGLRWSDGADLTADDICFSFEVARDARVGWQGGAWKAHIETCERLDAERVRFVFATVYPDQFMDANAGFIVPAHRLRHVAREQWARASDARQPVGCGPFRLAAWEPSVRLVFERNPYYLGARRPYLEQVELVVIADPLERVQALRDGRIDFLPQVPETAAADLRTAAAAGTSDVVVHSVRGRQYDFVCYNPHHPALAERDVRRALALAVDRDAIIRTFCSGFAEIFESPMVPILWAYDADAPLTPYDPRLGRELLDACGFRTGPDGVRSRDGVRLEFELATNADSARRTGAAEALVAYWRVVGVQAHLRLEERGALLARLDARQYEAALSGWRARLKPDLEPMWGTSSVGGKTNRVDYSNPEVDRLNAEALRCPDVGQARSLFARAQRLVAADHPYTWLYYLHDVAATRNCLHGAVIDARSVFHEPQDWWMTPARLTPSTRRD